MCGLFGIINPEPKTFDKRAFLTLGVNNDTRGGDSCGVFIDGQVEYGYDKLKLFADFWSESKLLKDTSRCTVALGHCRKASVGGIGIKDEKAQPVIIKNEQGVIEFVLTHNGTIKNYEELAKKYIPEINIKGMTDSQVMARIFYYAGYDVLGEYIGAGVFITADYRHEKPEIHLFKGESKQFSSSQTTSEERPLFFVHQGKSFVYSSIPDFLYTLFPSCTVYKINSNLLCTLKNNELHTVKEYDRTSLYQSVYSSNQGTNAQIARAYGYGRDWDEEDTDFSRYPVRNGGNAQGAAFQHQRKEETSQETQTPSTLETPRSTLLLNDRQLNLFASFYDTPADNANVGRYILGDRDSLMYKIANMELAHGIYKCAPSGLILKDTAACENIVMAYFFEGVPVKSAQCLNFLREMCDSWECSSKDLFDILPQLIYSLSPFPFKNSGITKDSKINTMIDIDNWKTFEGNVSMLFTDYHYPCKDGIISLTRYIDGHEKVINFYKQFAGFMVPDSLKKEFLTQYENY